jgi:hypothetical protein
MAADVQSRAALAGRLYVEACANPRSGSCIGQNLSLAHAYESTPPAEFGDVLCPNNRPRLGDKALDRTAIGKGNGSDC